MDIWDGGGHRIRDYSIPSTNDLQRSWRFETRERSLNEDYDYDWKQERRGVNIGKKRQTQQHYDMPYIGKEVGSRAPDQFYSTPSRTDIKTGKRNDQKIRKGKFTRHHTSHWKDSAFRYLTHRWDARSTSLICLPACLPMNGFYFSTKVTSALDTNLPITPETAVL